MYVRKALRKSETEMMKENLRGESQTQQIQHFQEDGCGGATGNARGRGKLVPELKAQTRLHSGGAISHPKGNTGRKDREERFPDKTAQRVRETQNITEEKMPLSLSN